MRDGDDGFEVFMARRHIKSDFAPDVYVFPGGKADPDDAVDGAHLVLARLPKLEDREPPGVGWRAIFMAAFRELFEESGLLLAWCESGVSPHACTLSRPLVEYRDRVRAGRISMAELAQTEALSFAGADLCLFSNWITPEALTKRFDTFFFLARLPEGGEARLADDFELTHSLWISPAEALTRFGAGEFPLVFATERHLDLLARYGSVDEAWGAASSAAVTPVSPRWLMKDGERAFVIPGDEGYETARVR